MVIGDSITWDIQGVPIESVVANLREVDWARFATNFFVVFPPGPLDEAPQSIVLIGYLKGEDARATLQRDLVGAFPNISVLPEKKSAGRTSTTQSSLPANDGDRDHVPSPTR